MVISNKCFQQNNFYRVTQFLLAYGLLSNCNATTSGIFLVIWQNNPQNVVDEECPYSQEGKTALHTHRM